MAVVTFPPRTVKAAEANPAPGGLYSAAAMAKLEDPTRLAGGVEVEAVNCGTTGRWDLDCEATGQDDKEGIQDPWPIFGSIGVWGAYDCGLVGGKWEDAWEGAQQALRLGEPVEVEEWVAPLLLAAAGTAEAVVGTDPVLALVFALGAVESEIGAATGVVHAARSAGALAAAAGLVVQGPGGVLLTPLGNRWAFGLGYGDLEGTLVGTGPVTVFQAPVLAMLGDGVRRNSRTAVAEREVAVGWECGAVAAEYGV